eukprot:133190_1
MNQTSTTKTLKCLCGNQLERDSSAGRTPCSNCSKWFDLATEFYWCTCYGQSCAFQRITGDYFRLCCGCFENIPSNQTLEQRLSFALQTAKSIIQQKTQAQEPINTYVCTNLKG